jgi:hypothetical protein
MRTMERGRPAQQGAAKVTDAVLLLRKDHPGCFASNPGVGKGAKCLEGLDECNISDMKAYLCNLLRE